MALVALGTSLLLAGQGCTSTAVETDPCPDDPGTPIATACDLLVPPMCERAVDSCGQEGTVQECIDKARPKCCQGACGRLMCAPDNAKILRCLQAYVGPDAGIDAAVAEPLPAPASAIPCSEVLQGFSPPECVEIVQLK